MIPFNQPYVGDQARFIFDRVASSTHHSGDGPVARECEARLSELLGGATVVLTPSCTHALELAALVLEVGPNDEVVVPSFTFTSTATAFALRGACIRFGDIDPESLNLDPASVERVVNERTKVIVPVHYAGVGCDLVTLGAVASRVGASIIEDNADGLFGTYEERPLGTFGDLAALSFHETKNVSCGEGGAIVVNDPELLDAVLIAREKVRTGTRSSAGQSTSTRGLVRARAGFLRNSRRVSCWRHCSMRTERRTVARRFGIATRCISRDWAAFNEVRLPFVPVGRTHPSHLFHLLLPDATARTRFIEHMAAHQVQVVFHYLPLHRAPAARRFGAADECPIAEDVAGRLVRLPLYQRTRPTTRLTASSAP